GRSEDGAGSTAAPPRVLPPTAPGDTPRTHHWRSCSSSRLSASSSILQSRRLRERSPVVPSRHLHRRPLLAVPQDHAPPAGHRIEGAVRTPRGAPHLPGGADVGDELGQV